MPVDDDVTLVKGRFSSSAGEPEHSAPVSEHHDDAPTEKDVSPIRQGNPLAEAQRTDPDLRLLFSLKSTGSDARTYEDIRAESGFSKQMFAQWDTVKIHDGVLCRRWNPKAVVHEVLQLLVPAFYKHDFLVKTHQGMT